MKLSTSFFIFYFILIVITFVITPYEAKLMNQELTWMYVLNFKEVIIFGFGLLIGFKVK